MKPEPLADWKAEAERLRRALVGVRSAYWAIARDNTERAGMMHDIALAALEPAA